jgi:hypothetical protein
MPEHLPLLIGASGAVITLGLAALRSASSRLKRPKLKVAFEPHRNLTNQPWGAGGQARWLRLSVENLPRREPAKSASAVLIDIAERNDLAAAVPFFNDARPLWWTHHPPGPIDVKPGVPYLVDVAKAIEITNDIRIAALEDFALPALSVGKNYIMTIRISANNMLPITVRLEVSCPGTWTSLTGSLWKE